MVRDLCFEIIEKCLNNCMFCSSNSNCNKTQIIQYEDFKRTIDYFMSTGGIEELSLSGGEPFLHPDVIKMVRYSKKLGIKTVIFTSGVSKKAELSEKEKESITNEMNSRIQEINRYEPDNEFLKQKVTSFYTKLLNPSEYTSISRAQLLELKKIGLDKIVFDYQAYEDETDYMLMGRKEDSRISLLKSIILATTIGLEVDIHFVPMKPNYKEIGDILEMLEIAEVKNISIYTLDYDDCRIESIKGIELFPNLEVLILSESMGEYDDYLDGYITDDEKPSFTFASTIDLRQN